MRHSSLATGVALTLLLSASASAQTLPETGAPTALSEGSDRAKSEVAAQAAAAPPDEGALPPSVAPALKVELVPELRVIEPTPAPLAPPLAPAADSLNSAPAAKASWSPVYTGSYFTRYEVRHGYRALNVERPSRFLEGDAIFYRMRLGVGTGLMDVGSGLKVGLQATPQATGVFGTLPSTISDAAFGLHEGYLRVQGDLVRADVGRFEMNYGDALVIGNLDWNETARSFDGARAHFAQAPDSMWVDAFATILHEGRSDGARFADGDLYFMGAYAALGPAVSKGLDLDVYALARVWPETTGVRLDATSTPPSFYNRKRAGEGTFGARAKQKIEMLDYRFEAGLQAGSRPSAVQALPAGGTTTQNVNSVLAYQADLEVGLSLVPDKLRIAAEALYASGNDPNTSKNEGWDELYPTAHKWLGLSDVFALNGIKRTNVASGVFHATTQPITGLTIQADGHLFARPEPVNGVRGFAAIEVDVGVTYVLAKGLKVHGLYALFMPQSDMYQSVPPATTTDAAQYTELELRYDM